jgi:hypothetical protein
VSTTTAGPPCSPSSAPGRCCTPVLLGLCLHQVLIRRSARELLPVAALAAGQVLELVLFATVHRPSPSDLTSTALSSGHTAAAVLGWGLIAWQLSRLGDRDVVWLGAGIAGAVVGATHVYLGLHWFTDAVVGLVTGTALLAIALIALSEVDRIGMARSGPVPIAPRTWAWLRTSRWAWSIPAAAAAVPIGGILASPADHRMIDLLVYRGAGGTAGAGENLYAYRTVFSMPFTYPPFAALIVEPLSRMPLGLAQALWTAATLAAVVALAPTALRPVADRIGVPLTVAVLLVSVPVRSHFHFGQINAFLVLLVAMDLLGRQRDRLAGLGLGLATALKLTPAMYLPWLLVTGQRSRLVRTVAWAAGVTLVGLLLLWPSSLPYLTDASHDTARFGRNDIPGNQSVRGMLLRALPDPTAERIWVVAALVLVAVGTYQAWRCERAGNRLAAVGVIAALSVAVSPISWVHHLVWLALPIAALAAAGRWRLVTAWTLVLVVSFVSIGNALRDTAPVLAEAITNVQGLTAVVAVLVLPALVGVGQRTGARYATVRYSTSKPTRS